ncbi:MAG: Uma2 family endonuclease [Oscillatoriales cyanobacterium SM2_1_8]|nr:Uma2 family endonuclease [Oscillatoriales cyanobacterium SM2_1_8]
MTIAPRTDLPDHRHLPETDGTFVKNFQEHPQSILLTDSIQGVLAARHPDGRYAIGQDCGIYWQLTEPLDRGVVAPDWFYVPDVPPLLDGQRRRSYVLWQEQIIPLLCLEFVSGDGQEERDATPAAARPHGKPGKFWVYEQALRVPYYGIYEVDRAAITLYQRVNGRYRICPPDGQGRVAIAPLGVALGIWWGHYLNQYLPWLRWWDAQGNLLLTGQEQAQQERQRANQAQQRADRLAAKLRALGIDPEDG